MKIQAVKRSLGLPAAVAAAVLALGAFSVRAAEEPADLDTVIVRPPFVYEGERSLWKLRKQLPELGYAGNVGSKGWVDQVWTFLLRDPAADLSHEQQLLIVRMMERDPALGH